MRILQAANKPPNVLRKRVNRLVTVGRDGDDDIRILGALHAPRHAAWQGELGARRRSRCGTRRRRSLKAVLEPRLLVRLVSPAAGGGVALGDWRLKGQHGTTGHPPAGARATGEQL